MAIEDSGTTRRSINPSPEADRIARDPAVGLEMPTAVEDAVASELANRAHQKLRSEIAQACRVHEQYLAEYGSLGDAIRSQLDASG